MKERTFLDYYEDYNESPFVDYGRMFREWVRFRGYIDTIFGSEVHIFQNNCFYSTDFPERNLPVGIYNTDIAKKLVERINYEGWGSQIYYDHITYLSSHTIEIIELDFVETFLTTLFSKLHHNCKITISNPDEVIEFFRERRNTGNIIRDKATLDSFMNDFALFINALGEKYPKYGYCLVEKTGNFDWYDFGVFIYSKGDRLSQEVMFYQIGDSN